MIRRGSMKTPTTLVFSPDGDTLIGAGPPQEIWWWDLRSIKLRAAFRIDGPISEIMTFSPDGTTLATVDQDNAIRLWDAVDVKLLSTLIGGEHSVAAIAFSPDGNLLASGGWDDLLLWDLRRSRRLAIFQEAHSPIQTLAFSPDGRTLVSGSVDSKVQGLLGYCHCFSPCNAQRAYGGNQCRCIFPGWQNPRQLECRRHNSAMGLG